MLRGLEHQFQVLNVDEQIQDPENFKFLQSSVSSSFSQGAPNPKKPGENLPAQKLKAVSDQLAKKPADALKFPALKVFTVDDPDMEQPVTFSLDTRRLLTFRMAKIHQARTKPAPIRELRESCWKMTSVNGGEITPTITDQGAKKDDEPAEYTMLYKVKQAILKASRKADVRCNQQNIVGEARELEIDNAVRTKLVRKFNYR